MKATAGNLPLEGVREAKILKGKEQVTCIQRVIQEALQLWYDDLQR